MPCPCYCLLWPNHHKTAVKMTSSRPEMLAKGLEISYNWSSVTDLLLRQDKRQRYQPWHQSHDLPVPSFRLRHGTGQTRCFRYTDCKPTDNTCTCLLLLLEQRRESHQHYLLIKKQCSLMIFSKLGSVQCFCWNPDELHNKHNEWFSRLIYVWTKFSKLSNSLSHIISPFRDMESEQVWKVRWTSLCKM